VGQVMLFLSPHLDDVVLSCPAFVQRAVAQGHDVRIATIFTSGPEAPKLYRARRCEDRDAVRQLGARPLHAGLSDAPFRSAQYRDFCGIVFGRAREYAATLRALIERLIHWIARLAPVKVVCPMAVGNHVDHRLVRDAALQSISPEQLLFYEDRPYAFIREQVDHVLGSNLAKRPKRFWSRYFAAAYVRNYRGSTSEDRIVRAWAKAPTFPSGYELGKTCTIECRPAECKRSLTAVRAYRTQLPDLFSDDQELEALYRSTPETIYRLTSGRPPIVGAVSAPG